MRGMTRWFSGLAITAAMVSASTSSAQTYQLTAILNGANEVPPTVTPATGFGTVTFNVVTNFLTVNETWTGLLTGATGAHIHCCAASNATGAVAIDFVGATGLFPTGLTAGSYVHTFDLMSAATYGSGFLTTQGSVTAARNTVVGGLLAGQTYLNIHTANFPAGEIRGQLVGLAVVPEPSTYALMGAGLSMIGFVRWRRRRQA